MKHVKTFSFKGCNFGSYHTHTHTHVKKNSIRGIINPDYFSEAKFLFLLYFDANLVVYFG